MSLGTAPRRSPGTNLRHDTQATVQNVNPKRAHRFGGVPAVLLAEIADAGAWGPVLGGERFLRRGE
jgi:hypothetical protein